MHLSFIVFSLLVSLNIFAATDWRISAEGLLSQQGTEEASRKSLEQVKDLDASLIKALEKEGRDEMLALGTIRKLPRLSLVDHLIKKTETMDVHQERTAHYYVSLLSMVNTTEGDKILDHASKKIDLTSAKISSSLRIALLSAMNIKEKLPPLKTMETLLEDTSYEIRLKVIDMAYHAIEKNPSQYQSFLKKSLTLSPYSLRLKALEQIKVLPPEEKARYKEAIVNCSKSDQNEIVKESCSTFRF